ncbi:Polyadenylate-binding protein RBP47B' [Apostasia shenzhenica]|uniref:Polyadenylate-binding protein RBP47B n=1 Tax=Apostasia shenzhenica TaxID=1088818 RepID=A0A2I0A2T9_9ASPA|nr:Polyadenylate-binding protein RBP47B' [Apostasia shenzhenica]
MTSMAGAVPTIDHREEPYDPLIIPSVNKLNADYLAVQGNVKLGRILWLRNSHAAQHA